MPAPSTPHGRPDRGHPPDAPALHRIARTGDRHRGRPDSTGVRLVIGLAGLASASALTTAMLPSILPRPAAVTVADQAASDPTAQPEPSVIHITRVVQLAPGQTLPPDAGATTAPAAPTPKATPRPTPRVVVQTVTRQSGRP